MNYCITTFGWTTELLAIPEATDSQLIAVAQDKLKNKLSMNQNDLRLGEVIQTTYTHEPKFNLRLTQRICKDKDSDKVTVSFYQEAAVLVQSEHEEDDFISEARTIITAAFPNLDYILGTEDYPVIASDDSSKTMLVFQR